MNFTHLKPKTTEEVINAFSNLENEQVYQKWNLSYGFDIESIAYEELKRRRVADKINFIEQHPWFDKYKKYVHTSKTTEEVEFRLAGLDANIY